MMPKYLTRCAVAAGDLPDEGERWFFAINRADGGKPERPT